MATIAHPSLTNCQDMPFAAASDAAHRPGIVHRVWNTLGVWHRRAEGRRRLAELSDRELSDFGATRADVQWEISQPFWRSVPPC